MLRLTLPALAIVLAACGGDGGERPVVNAPPVPVPMSGGNGGTDDPEAQPLHKAAEYGDLAAVKALLDAGADPNTRDEKGETPLHTAARANVFLWGILKGESEIANADKRDESDVFAKMMNYQANARSEMGVSVIEALIAVGADPNARAAQEGGATPLHLAVSFVDNPDPSTIEALITGGADPNARTEKGFTPIHVARSRPAVEALVAAGADPNTRTEYGHTPLHQAVARNDSNLPVVEALIAAGASANTREEKGNTPLHMLAFAASEGCRRRV